MVVEIATLPVKAGEEEAFAAAVKQAVPLLKRARGCLGVEVLRCVEEPSSFRLVVRWETLENHTVDFRGSPDGAELRRLLAPHYAGTPNIIHAAPLLGA